MKKKDARFLHPVVQEELRNSAVEMFLNGYSQVDISKILGASTRAIYNWVKAYKRSGRKGLKIRKRGRPEGIQLKSWQCAQTVKIIINYCPDEVSLPFFLWTREAVGLLIKRKFQINLSKWTVGRYLDQLGAFSSKTSASCD